MIQGRNVSNEGPNSAGVYSITSPVPAASMLPASGTPDETNTLKSKGVFVISDNFTPTLAKNVVTWILESQLDKNAQFKNLTLFINSPGGEVPSAFAIIDAMQGSRIPVHTVGMGQISSCGFLTFIAGAKGHRILTPNCAILSHQWAWGSMGKEHELIAQVKEYGLTTDRIIQHYQKCTGLDVETIKEKLLPPHDVWLSTQEALDMNICDAVKLVSA